MPISNHLLERAYQLIEANQIQNAELVLDAVVRVDPQNVEAWTTYLQIHQSQGDLDWLRERLLKTRELSEKDKNNLLEYQSFLSKQLLKSYTHETSTVPYQPYNLTQKNEVLPQETPSNFELIDVFDYNVREVRIAENKRPRKRRLASETSVRLIILFVLFVTSIQLLNLGLFLGYAGLAVFFVASVTWLMNYRVNSPSQLNTSRSFAMKTKSGITLHEKPVIKLEKKSEKKPRIKIKKK